MKTLAIFLVCCIRPVFLENQYDYGEARAEPTPATPSTLLSKVSDYNEESNDRPESPEKASQTDTAYEEGVNQEKLSSDKPRLVLETSTTNMTTASISKGNKDGYLDEYAGYENVLGGIVLTNEDDPLQSDYTGFENDLGNSEIGQSAQDLENYNTEKVVYYGKEESNTAVYTDDTDYGSDDKASDNKNATSITFGKADYGLGSGFDIYLGNPRSKANAATNNGYRAAIFSLPKDYIAISDVNVEMACKSCSLEPQVIAMKNIDDYINWLHEAAHIDSVDEDLPPEAFTGSMEYRRMELLFQQNRTIFEWKKSCIVFCDSLTMSHQPPFSPDFVDAIASLPTNNANATQLIDFIELFGTHVLTSAEFGSLVGQLYSINTAAMNYLQRNNIEVSASTWAVKNIQQMILSEMDISVGIAPNKMTDSAQDWTEKAVALPRPVNIGLLPIYKLLTKENFPNDDMIEDKRLAIRMAQTRHCNLLWTKAILATCTSIIEETLQENDNKFYLIHGNFKKTEAATACSARGARLAMLKSAFDFHLIKQLLLESTATEAWISLIRTDSEHIKRGKWRWDDGDPLSAIYSTLFWHPDEPSDASEKCVIFVNWGKYVGMADMKCARQFPALCEVQ